MKSKKILKISLYIILGLVSALVIAAIVIPIFFKDSIKAQIDQAIAESVNAEVNFKADDFSISFFRSFPYLSIGQKNLSVIGKEAFAGDTLASIANTRITVNVWSALFGDEIKVRGIYLTKPRVFIKVLADGRANYDIAKPAEEEEPQDTTATEEEAAAEFKVNIRRWQINEGVFEYDDKSLGAYTRLEGFSHEGRGNLTQEVFDLFLSLKIEDLDVAYGGITYLSDKFIDTELNLNINLPEFKFTIKDNYFKLNDFAFVTEGFVQMKDEDINMDIRYQAQETKFKNILSLVPGIFTEGFEELKTKGELSFKGFVKGIYNEKKMPGFNLDLKVKDGFFQYPDLPAAVSGVNLDLVIDNPSGDFAKTLIDLKKFNMKFDKHPLSARALLEDLGQKNIDAEAKASINLADLNKMLPLPDITLRGNYNLDLKAKGAYNETRMPSVQADMGLRQGYVKTSYYPAPMEDITFIASVSNPNGQYEATKVNLSDFHMTLEGETFRAKALLDEFNDLRYDLLVKGAIDLTKIMKIYPIEGMTLAGRIVADIATKGRLSYLMNSEYEKLPTKGELSISKFLYKDDTYLPQGFRITQAQSSFNPQNIELKQMDGFLGKSDIHITGNLSNYIAFLFQPDAVLKGQMNFRSDKFDVNEWIPEAEITTTTETPSPASKPEPKPETPNNDAPSTTSTSSENMVVLIPRNIDFRLNSEIKQVVYGKIPIEDVKGIMTIKDGVLSFEEIDFNSLGGSFLANGAYDSRDPQKPKYRFEFGIKSLPIDRAYESFFPIGPNSLTAADIKGTLSSTLKLSGALGQDMMPILDETVNGLFNMSVREAEIRNAPILSRLSNFTKLDQLDKFNLKDVIVKANIKDGKVKYEPFDLQAGDYKMKVSGENSLDGSLDFVLNLDVPVDKLTGTASTAIAALTGKSLANQEKIRLDFAVGGTYAKPDIKMLGSEGKGIKEQVSDKVKEEVKTKTDEVKEEVKEEVGKQAEKIMTEARQQAERVKQEAKTAAERIRKEADTAYEKAKDAAAKQNILVRKSAELAAKKAKEQAYKRASQLEQEAERKADQIIKSAQERADKL